MVILISVCLFGACRPEKTNDAQQGILSREKFTELLKDFQLAEASINIRKLTQPDDIVYAKKVYKGIFAKYKISEEQFNQNIDYYKTRPQELLQIYSDVVDSLSKMQSTIGQRKSVE